MDSDNSTYVDDDAIVACADIVLRTGATEFQIGYLRDEESEGHPVKTEDAGWYAHCIWRGNKIIVEEQRGPSEAADGLSRRILNGGMCTHCREKITLSNRQKGCKWTRMGKRWERGCAAIPRTIGQRGSGRSSGF